MARESRNLKGEKPLKKFNAFAFNKDLEVSIWRQPGRNKQYYDYVLKVDLRFGKDRVPNTYMYPSEAIMTIHLLQCALNYIMAVSSEQNVANRFVDNPDIPFPYEARGKIPLVTIEPHKKEDEDDPMF